MTPHAHAHIVSEDLWVGHPQGRLFARTWSDPGAAEALASTLAPIVLLHDSLGSVALWRDFPARLAAATGRAVIAYDRLGFGQSDPRADVLTPDFIGDEAASYFPAVREQLGIERFVVFGHSVGGGMAIHCAARFPDDCEALITESAQVCVEERTLQGVGAAKLQFADGEQFGRLEKYHGGKAAWVLDAWTGSWLSEAFASWSLRDVLAQVSVPTMAIHGSDDEYGSTRQPALIAQWCRAGARVEILRDLHHLPHREQPDQVVDLVRDFLGADQRGEAAAARPASSASPAATSSSTALAPKVAR